MAQVSPESPAPRGRRRSTHAHQAVLRAASDLLHERGYVGLSIEAIAARAGVGKQTIYRWWSSKGAVVLDAFRNDFAANGLDSRTDPAALTRRTAAAFLAADIQWDDNEGFAAGLRIKIRHMTATLADPVVGPYIAALTCEAQLDPAFAAVFRREIVEPSREAWRTIFGQAREAGEIRADLDLDLAIDLLNGPLWYRLLLRPGAMGALDPNALCDAVLRMLCPAVSDVSGDCETG